MPEIMTLFLAPPSLEGARNNRVEYWRHSGPQGRCSTGAEIAHCASLLTLSYAIEALHKSCANTGKLPARSAVEQTASKVVRDLPIGTLRLCKAKIEHTLTTMYK